MNIFDYMDNEQFGVVEGVDTATVIVKIEDNNCLNKLQVNHLVCIQSSKVGQNLIGLVSKIIRKTNEFDNVEPIQNKESSDIVKISLIGTHFEKLGIKDNIFKRTIYNVPTINAKCYLIDSDRLKKFMQAISSISLNNKSHLDIGTYSIDDEAKAYLNGNKLFQRHSVIVGSTGSGKSWCVAKILEQIATLKSANAILFDIHGEYNTLKSDGFSHYKIAGANDTEKNNILFLPYWLLNYEEMISIILDRSDTNAPNQAMLFSQSVISEKKKFLNEIKKSELENIITLDSPVPYNLSNLIECLKKKDEEMVPSSARGEKAGTYNGKLTRFIQRLENKKSDRRLNFMFNENSNVLNYNYIFDLSKKLMSPSSDKKNGGVKIIDFSEVPSDILPLMVSLIARLILSIQQWTDSPKRHPIAIFCDEAHLYIPNNTEKASDQASVYNFERISKEGRKYGVGLVVISQRPSEVNRTVLSQSSNFIAMRLTNIDDQAVIKRLLPDSLGDYGDILPILDIGEAIVVGDASLLPSRVKISEPEHKPMSATIEFWDEWLKNNTEIDINKSIESMIKQSKS